MLLQHFVVISFLNWHSVAGSQVCFAWQSVGSATWQPLCQEHPRPLIHWARATSACLLGSVHLDDGTCWLPSRLALSAPSLSLCSSHPSSSSSSSLCPFCRRRRSRRYPSLSLWLSLGTSAVFVATIIVAVESARLVPLPARVTCACARRPSENKRKSIDRTKLSSPLGFGFLVFALPRRFGLARPSWIWTPI